MYSWHKSVGSDVFERAGARVKRTITRGSVSSWGRRISLNDVSTIVFGFRTICQKLLEYSMVITMYCVNKNDNIFY